MPDDPQSRSEFADFDHRTGGDPAEPECAWARMRAAPELPFSELYGGFHVVTRYDDLAEAAARCRTYSSASGISFPSLDFSTRLIPAEVDPPLHKEYRALLSGFLTRGRAQAMEPAVRAKAVALIDRFAGRRRIDFVQAFARPFPVVVSLGLLDFPLEDAALLDHLIEELHEKRGSPKAQRAAEALTDRLERFLIDRKARARGPDEGIAASIALGRVAGRPLTLAEQVSMVRLLLFGGFDTTAIALAAAVRWLAEHPADARRLRQDPGLLDPAIEEFVRFSSPASHLRRTVTEAAELGGSRLEAGDRVLLCFSAANRDPAKFEDPDTVVLDRQPNHHLGFGAGVHRCVGSFVAKLMMRLALEELLRRYEGFDLDPERPIAWKHGENRGMTSLPILLRPRGDGDITEPAKGASDRVAPT
jgi:cytochrome P450